MRFRVVNIGPAPNMGGMVEDLRRSWEEARERFAEQEREIRQREAERRRREEREEEAEQTYDPQVQALCEIVSRYGGVWSGESAEGQGQRDAVGNVLDNVPPDLRDAVTERAQELCPPLQELIIDIELEKMIQRPPPPPTPREERACYACAPGDYRIMTAFDASQAGCTKTNPDNCDIPTGVPTPEKYCFLCDGQPMILTSEQARLRREGGARCIPVDMERCEPPETPPPTIPQEIPTPTPAPTQPIVRQPGMPPGEPITTPGRPSIPTVPLTPGQPVSPTAQLTPTAPITPAPAMPTTYTGPAASAVSARMAPQPDRFARGAIPTAETLSQQMAAAPFTRGLQAVGGFGGLIGGGTVASPLGTMPTGGMPTGTLALPNWVMAGRQVPLQVRRDSMGFGRLW